jgi:hypothetical protein
MIRGWHAKCFASHMTCQEAAAYVPKRLLNIASMNDQIHLVETATIKEAQDEEQRAARYIAVSHSWGTQAGITPPRTTVSNIAVHEKTGIALADFPPLFRDILSLARALGYVHVWIDSLCIVQDDAADWTEQSVLMANVYGGADLTLSAASMRHCHDGLFGRRFEQLGDIEGDDKAARQVPVRALKVDTQAGGQPPSEPGYANVYARESNARYHGYIIAGTDRTRDWRAIECPLLDRAWVFQESLLSRRIVYFTAREMIWQCREARRCEDGSLHDEGGSDSISAITPFSFWDLMRGPWWGNRNMHRICAGLHGASSRQDVFAFWRSCVELYSTLRLTRESDRGVAIDGVAQLLRARLRDLRQGSVDEDDVGYLAGMWRGDLPKSLAWSVPTVFGSDKDAAASQVATRRLDVPSWSWMSRTTNASRSPVGWIENYKQESLDPHVKLIIPDSDATPSERTETTLELEGPTCAATLRKNFDEVPEHDWQSLYSVAFGKGGHEPRKLVADCPGDAAEGLADSLPVLCLSLIGNALGYTIDTEGTSSKSSQPSPETRASSYALVLRQVDDCQSVFRRVGIVFMSDSTTLGPWPLWLIRKVKIV